MTQKNTYISFIYCLLIFIMMAPFYVSPANGETVRVDITQGKVEPLPIAIPAFIGADDESTTLAHNISQVIINDLYPLVLYII